jgi:hypothetical protein
VRGLSFAMLTCAYAYPASIIIWKNNMNEVHTDGPRQDKPCDERLDLKDQERADEYREHVREKV